MVYFKFKTACQQEKMIHRERGKYAVKNYEEKNLMYILLLKPFRTDLKIMTKYGLLVLCLTVYKTTFFKTPGYQDKNLIFCRTWKKKLIML